MTRSLKCFGGLTAIDLLRNPSSFLISLMDGKPQEALGHDLCYKGMKGFIV